VRSSIANKPKTRGTMTALGLRKIGDTNVLPDRPEIRGMLARVAHLVTVVDNSAASAAGRSKKED
jgi:large subunit ribosomal protein L30